MFTGPEKQLFKSSLGKQTLCPHRSVPKGAVPALSAHQPRGSATGGTWLSFAGLVNCPSYTFKSFLQQEEELPQPRALD